MGKSNFVEVIKKKYQSLRENNKVSKDVSADNQLENNTKESKGVGYKSKKALYTMLTAGTLALTACSQGEYVNNPNNSTTPTVTLTPTPRPGTTFLEEDVVFSIPEPFRTVEEIKASGEEVTVEEVQNAYENLSYKVAQSLLKNEEDYKYVSSKFISITPKTYNKGATMEDIKERNEPFYTEFEDGRYIVDVNFEFAVLGIPQERCIRVHLPNEFGQVLEDLGLRDREIDRAYLNQLGILGYGDAEVGNIAYKPVEITPEFIAERLAGPENTEKRERVIDFFEKTFDNFDDLYRAFEPDTSQSYME